MHAEFRPPLCGPATGSADIVGRLSHRPQSIKGPVALIAGGVLIVVAVVVVLLVGGGGGSRSAANSGDLTTGVRSKPLESIFESDGELVSDPVKTLAMLHRMGVDRVRVFVGWGALGARPPIAPDPFARIKPAFDASQPSAYPSAGWALYDSIVRAAAAENIGLDFTLGPPAPLWATGHGEPAGGPAGVWKISARDFGEFVHAAGVRYSGHYPDPLHPGQSLPPVHFWAIWNEPNLGVDLAPQAVQRGSVETSPKLYRAMVDSAFSALQSSGHGHDTILIGELAPNGSTVPPAPGNFDMMPGLRFLRALYCVDSSYQRLRGVAATERGCPAAGTTSAFASAHPGLFRASGFADHPYTQGQPPDQPTPDEPDYTDFPAISKLATTLDRLQQAYGSSTRFPIYSTEFGYWTNPPNTGTRADKPATAAALMNQTEFLSWRDPRIRSYDQYLLQDSPAGVFPSGLKYASGAPKPSYAAYLMPLWLPATSAAKGQAVEVWGCARPSIHAGGRGLQQVKIEFSPGSGGSFHTLRTVDLASSSCYFDVRQGFPATGSVRLAWSYPHGETIHSRIAQVTIH